MQKPEGLSRVSGEQSQRDHGKNKGTYKLGKQWNMMKALWGNKGINRVRSGL